MRDDVLLVKIIYESIKRIEKNALKGEENFFSDITTQDAILRNFQVIGDAIKDLSDDYRKAHSVIPLEYIHQIPRQTNTWLLGSQPC